MAEFDYTNWNEERAALKAEIYRELREQRDRKREITLSGQIEIDPQFTTKQQDYIYGPFFFPSPFSTAPNIVFSQSRAEPEKPFWALMDVARWENSNGQILGFYLGVYALDTAPAGLYRHNITWIAQGTASVYHESNASDAWSAAYAGDYNSMLHSD